MIDTKKCTQCGLVKPFKEFGKEKKGKYGLKSKCRVCMTEIRSEQYKKNKDRELEYGKTYRETNRDKEKARYKRYRELNPESIKESQKKYRENNPEKIKIRKQKWADTNRDLINSYTKSNRDTRREFLDIIKLENGCQICGYNEHPRALQFDHIVPEDKLFTISSSTTCSMKKLMEEISKCRILCANCHSIHSWQEEHSKLRKTITKNKLSNDREETT